MGRFSHYDTDEERLPEGMTRIGYDADTQVYTYRDESDGSTWESAPGVRYGRMHRVSGPSNPSPSGDDDNAPPPYSNTHTEYAGYTQPQRSSWRQDNMPLLNFFLLIGLFLLAVFYFMGVGFGGGSRQPLCAEGQAEYEVRKGDTCWAIAETRGLSVQELTALNPGVDCDRLGVGSVLCLPGKEQGKGQDRGSTE